MQDAEEEQAQEGGNEEAAEKLSLAEAKRKKRNLKTKITRLKAELVDVDDVSTIKSKLNELHLVQEETFSVIDRLCEIDKPDNISKYEAESEELQNAYDCTVTQARNLFDHSRRPTQAPASPDRMADEVKLSPTQDVNRDMYHQLKRVSIPKFTGNKSDFRAFMDAFVECIDKTSASASYKLLQLRQHLQGEALKSVGGYPASELGYEGAKKKLEQKYGGQRRFLLRQLDAIRTMKPVSGDLKSLEDFLDQLELTLVSLKEQGRQEELEADSMFYCVIKSKLSSTLIAHYKRWIVSEVDSPKENLESFILWLANEVQLRTEAQEEGYKQQTINKPHIAQNITRSKTFATYQTKQKCAMCGSEQHWISNCENYKGLKINARWAIAKEKGLCYRCLSGTHRGAACRYSRKCSFEGCSKSHHGLLHSVASEFAPRQAINFASEQQVEDQGQTLTSTDVTDYIAMRTIPVILANGSKELQINALLDECSTDSYLSEHVAAQLGLEGESRTRKVSVIGGNASEIRGRRVNAALLRVVDRKHICDISSFTVGRVTGEMEIINWNDYKEKWKHIENINFPRLAKPRTIDLLIGLNDSAMQLHSCLKEIHGRPGQPIARLTPLGWTCIGHVPSSRCYLTSTYFTSGRDDSCLSDILKISWEIDSQGIKNTVLSPIEQIVENRTEMTIKNENGRYQVTVPWKDDEPQLPNNWHMAKSRLRNSENSLRKQPGVAIEYQKIIKNYEAKGYTRKLSNDEIISKECGWYLPHFPVVRPDKDTTKVRIVMDAAAKCDGKSLNDCIHPGPKLQSDLLNVLIRFRHQPIAISADISEMFLQVELEPGDRKYHRFLWRDMDVNKPIEVYEFNRLVFGNTSSPYLSQKVIRTHATKNAEKYPRASESLLNSMYVDDLLDSTNSVGAATELREQTTDLLKSAGFTIRKWLSNELSVLADVAPKDRASSINIEDSELPRVKTLGIMWDANTDKYLFLIKFPEIVALTKRNVFRLSATLFDPLNFLSPITIRAKILMQESWLQGLDWDTLLPRNLSDKWQQWFSELPQLEEIKIDRCLVQKTNSVVNKTLHTFVDASKDAYATAVYLRAEYDTGDVTVNLITSKARVSPLKAMSIPRLELCGAVLGVKLTQTVVNTLEIPTTDVVYWSDSMNVLYWINGSSRTYKPFVASRVGFIHENSESSQWNHVPTKQNSADLPTRGTNARELNDNKMWWHGPEFLQRDKSQWPKRAEPQQTKAATDEIRSADVTMATADKHNNRDLGRLNPERFSTWTRLLRVTAWILRLLHNVRNRDNRLTENHLSNAEMDCAKIAWYKIAQADEFSDEILDLLSKQSVKKSSKILKLNPRIDDDGLLRVDGRLKLADHIPHDARFPVILPRKHDVTRLVIENEDKVNNHERGVSHILSEIRTYCWIIHGREAIKAYQSKCPGCIRRRAKMTGQMMAPLPRMRLGDPLRAFAKTGVDYGGPFLTKHGRGRVRTKRYLCLFTCLATRAVHLEVAFSLDTDSFLLAFSRFCDRRNRPLHVWSDNGSNFIGGDRELKELVDALDREKIINSAANRGIAWSFNPPEAPHFGGVWEAMIKSAKRAIKAVISDADLTDEELITAATGAEGLINSRPLTYQSDDPKDSSVLTPNHFLFGQVGGQLAPETVDSDFNLKKRWRRVQELIGHFWRRWLKEFLPTLQCRKKWHTPHENLKVGDIVVVIEPNSPRGNWPLGRITETYPGHDGYVRVVKVLVGGKEYKRIVHRLYKLC